MMQRGRPNSRPTRPDPQDDGPRPEDIEDFGDVTRPCQKCGAMLYDDVELCYKCGHAVGAEVQQRPGIWVIIVIGLIVVGLLTPFFMRIF